MSDKNKKSTLTPAPTPEKMEEKMEEKPETAEQLAARIIAEETSKLEAEKKSETEALAKMTAAERRIHINKKFKEQVAAIKSKKLAELEDAKKLGTTANRGDKNNASYAIRTAFLTSLLADTPKQIHAKIIGQWDKATMSSVSTLTADCRANIIAFFDLPADIRAKIAEKYAPSASAPEEKKPENAEAATASN